MACPAVVYCWPVATPATFHSVGARRRLPLSVVLAVPALLVVVPTAMLGAVLFAHGVRYHEGGLAVAGLATALVAPVIGVSAWLARTSAANRVARLIFAEAATLLGGVGVLLAWVAVVVVALSHLSFGPSNAATFGHGLQPIPVTRATCPYLSRVHDSAVRAGAASGAAMANTDPVTWRTMRTSIGGTLRAFDQDLHDAAKRSPAPIATKLLATRAQVDLGIVSLSSARTGYDWSTHAIPSITSGYSSLVDASDLTGRACGSVVAPNANVFFSVGGN
jgi:hypothetical protein